MYAKVCSAPVRPHPICRRLDIRGDVCGPGLGAGGLAGIEIAGVVICSAVDFGEHGEHGFEPVCMPGDVEAEALQPPDIVSVDPLNFHAERKEGLRGHALRFEDIGDSLGGEFRIMAPAHEKLNFGLDQT